MITHPIAFGIATFTVLAILGQCHPDARWPERLGRMWLIIIATAAATVAVWS